MAIAVSRSGSGCPAGTNGSLHSASAERRVRGQRRRGHARQPLDVGRRDRAPMQRGRRARRGRRRRPIEAGVDAPAGCRTCARRGRRRRAARAPARPGRSTSAGSQRDRARLTRVPEVSAPPDRSRRLQRRRQREHAAPSAIGRRRREGQHAADSGATSMSIGSCGVDIRRDQRRLAAQASAVPSAPPAIASTRPSVRSWRTMRPRPAPSARRSAISRWREDARASSRPATLAQAISSTSADDRHQDDAAASDRSCAGTTSRCRPA